MPSLVGRRGILYNAQSRLTLLCHARKSYAPSGSLRKFGVHHASKVGASSTVGWGTVPSSFKQALENKYCEQFALTHRPWNHGSLGACHTFIDKPLGCSSVNAIYPVHMA